MARTLYQARAQGIPPPVIDISWMQGPQVPGRRPPTAHLAQGFTAPAQQPVPPSDSWLPPVAPSRIDRPRMLAGAQPALAMPAGQPLPPADSWLPPVAPSAISRPRMPTAQQIAFVGPQRQPDPPVDGWLAPLAPTQLLPAPRVRQADITAPVRQPVPDAASWLPGIQQPILVPRRAQQPDAVTAPVQQPEPAADGWLPASQPNPRAPARLLEALQQALALPPRQPDPTWGWDALAPAWLLGKPPIQAPGFVGPLYFEPPVPPPSFGWYRPASEPSPHRAFRAFLYGGATLLYAPPIIIARPGRVLPLLPDTRDLLLPPDIRTIILPLDEAPMPPVPAQYWSPASADDVDFYWLSLSLWIPPDDTILTPSAAVTPITDDPMPLEVVPGSVVVETGDRRVYVPPGVPVIDPGPRIRMQMQGGTFGKTYTTTITWTDSQGRTINRQALLTIQWP